MSRSLGVELGNLGLPTDCRPVKRAGGSVRRQADVRLQADRPSQDDEPHTQVEMIPARGALIDQQDPVGLLWLDVEDTAARAGVPCLFAPSLHCPLRVSIFRIAPAAAPSPRGTCQTAPGRPCSPVAVGLLSRGGLISFPRRLANARYDRCKGCRRCGPLEGFPIKMATLGRLERVRLKQVWLPRAPVRSRWPSSKCLDGGMRRSW